MSQTTTQDTPPAPLDPAAAESIARHWGWKPKEEFKGDPTKWVEATDFVNRARETPPVLMERVRAMDQGMTKLERIVSQQSTELTAAKQAVLDMTDMLRRSDERGYKRARAELMQQREQAVANGDTATFKVADEALHELEDTRPKAAPAPKATEPAPQPQPNGGMQPEVQQFYADNPWYTTDSAMRTFADRIHVGLFKSDPHLSLAENLKIVHEEVRQRFPAKFQTARRDPPAESDDGGEAEPPADNPRRGEARAVTPAGDEGGRRPRGSRRDFAAMPADAKAAYKRYAKMLEGKGAPLSEKEYAESYWQQFEEA